MPDPIKRSQQPWCPTCRAPAGPDCADISESRRSAVKRSRRDSRSALRSTINQLSRQRLLPFYEDDFEDVINTDLF